MRKLFKSILSTFLALTLIISSTCTAFATEFTPNQYAIKTNVLQKIENFDSVKVLSTSQKKAISTEIDLLYSYGLPITEISDVLTNTKEFIYELKLSDEVIDQVSVTKNSDGVKFIITEGDIYNTLIYKTDGNILLDGNIVEITYETVEENSLINATPRTGGFNW